MVYKERKRETEQECKINKERVKMQCEQHKKAKQESEVFIFWFLKQIKTKQNEKKSTTKQNKRLS